MIKQTYDFTISSWQTLVNTPHYLLDAFKSPNKHTLYNWNHSEYQHTLEKANWEKSSKKRDQLLLHAHNILIEEAPLIPLYHEQGFCIKNPYLKGFVQDMIVPDFKKVYFDVNCKTNTTMTSQMSDIVPYLDQNVL